MSKVSVPTGQDPGKVKGRAAFSWTQPVCVRCWVDLVLKTGRAADPDPVAFCCFCRDEIPAGNGRYDIRLNPGTVPYPTVRKDQE